ncbi:DEAD/DEAH box helicase [Nocardia spumae]|uniref:DEAD/DEAH box helicase n=1 Tax=Nocardia spumae TaxID=2887190 RepID=UPI001D148859|nr:DEAD/DEAH box helicase [Nocardia spumae]
MKTSSPSFALLGVRPPLAQALAANGIAAPFPIQADTLPDSLAGRNILGRGRTGSGKTLAFTIPVIDRLGETGRQAAPNRPVGLVLAPTRELATQIAMTMEPLAAVYGMSVTTVFGGVPQQRQVRSLRRGADIVVACPGRLEDLMQQELIALDDIRITVIDEADHMADLGFLPAVTRILAATPSDGQRLLFSATLDKSVNRLVDRFLPGAVRHSVGEADTPVATMAHHIFESADMTAKKALVQQLAAGAGRRILFTRTKHQARRLARQLRSAGIAAVELHGDLAQNARDRNLAAFAGDAATVLVATDVAARGVHVDDVELVVHVDPPAEHKAYLHRSGRTARAGGSGDVVTLMLPAERGTVTTLLRKAGIDAAVQQVSEDSPAVSRLVGPIAALVDQSQRGALVPSAEAKKSAAQPSPRAQKSRRHGAGSGGGAAAGGGGRRRATRDRVAGDRVAGGRVGDRGSDGRPSGDRTAGARTAGDRSTRARTNRDRGTGGRVTADRAAGDRVAGRRGARGHGQGVAPAGSTGGRAGFSRTAGSRSR